jgi:hypothetical protein
MEQTQVPIEMATEVATELAMELEKVEAAR